MNASLAALWPPPAVVSPVRSLRTGDEHYLAVPSTEDPRLLVPSGVPGADRMLARHGGGHRTRLVRGTLRRAHRWGLSSFAPLPRLQVTADPAGIEQHLADVLGRPVRVGVLLGPPRANLKPVLQVFAPDGTVLAFAKVATSAVTVPLLLNEAAALQRLARDPLPGVLTPALLDLASWRDLPVLVQSALPSAQSDRQPTALPTAALAALTASVGLRRAPMRGSAFWAAVDAAGPPSWNGLDVSVMGRLHEVLDDEAECLFGAWHGDFGPWNAACGPDRLEVWDWERFDPDVPAGLDAAHWRAQLDVGREPAAAWQAMRRDVQEVLEATGERSDSAVVAACYLLAIWARYRHDAVDRATPALRARVAWLCQVAQWALPSLEGAGR